MRSFRAIARLFACTLLSGVAIPIAPAQSILGSISGAVQDPTGARVAGAQVTAMLVSTGSKREATADERGDFNLVNLEPGVYSVTVQAAGFKTSLNQSVTLPPSERLVLGEIVLSVGDVKDTVTVSAQSAAVQTASAERAGVLTNTQVQNLTVLSRDVYGLVGLIPGVQYEGNGGAPSQPSNVYFVSANGGRYSANDISLDGVSTNTYATPWASSLQVSMDSIAQVKVLSGTFQAEYGRASGANIQLVSKSGTKDFHGMGGYFLRNEDFNGNTFFNNRLGKPRAKYRYNAWNYNVGGPVIIPGTRFNKSREKLFFFWSQEYWPTTTSALATYTVPTKLERNGDFSQSVNQNGTLITVLDPSTRQPLPGNIMPASAINKSSQALLSFLPQANFLNRSISNGAYNYTVQQVTPLTYRVDTLKLDYNLSSRDIISLNISDRNNGASGYYGPSNMSNAWPQLAATSVYRGVALIGRYNHVFSPTLVNEFNVGVSYRQIAEAFDPASLRTNQRNSVGYTAGQINPSSNPLNLIPDATFGSIPSAAPLQIDYRFPTATSEPTYQFVDGLTKITGPHTLKFGIQADYMAGHQTGYNYYMGRLDFASSTLNPLDTRYPYANAMFGVYNSYQEDSSLITYHARERRIDWYGQDTWKATSRLTLDYGLRFQWNPWPTESNGLISGFVQSLWNPSKAPVLIGPTLVGGQKYGLNPVSGQVYPATTIGAFAPGTGDPNNGLVTPTTNPAYKNGLVNGPAVVLSPRLGFALDVFGNGKTAIRGGVSILYDRPYVNDVVRNLLLQPPQISTQSLYYGTIDTIPAAKGFVFPVTARGLERNPHMPEIYNLSLSVQHDLGFGTVLDVAYVGALGRHLSWQRQLNDIPLGRDFNPAYADPTNPSAALPANFLRPLTGYQALQVSEYADSSSYHALQAQVNRRFGGKIQYGVAFTWSKSMDYAAAQGDADQISPLVPRSYYYGVTVYDRPVVVKPNFVWDLPRASQFVGGSRLAKEILDHWQFSGILTFQSGQPTTVGFTTTVPMDITGTPSLSPRINVTGDPTLPSDQRSFSKAFNTSVFALPAIGTLGNAGKYILRLPRINNWDLAILKSIQVRESMHLQLRWEMYNALNHTQFTAFNSTASFAANGSQTNTSFGQYTAAANPRTCQASLRFQF